MRCAVCTLSLLLAAMLAGGGPLRAALPEEVSSRAMRVQKRAIVVDTHCDTTQRLFSPEFDFFSRQERGHVDLPRIREGGVDAIFFSIYMSGRVTGPEAVKRALRQIDAVRGLVARDPRNLALAVTAAEVRRAHKRGKVAVLMGMEGGHMIDDDLGVLRMYAALGVRYLTLTHSIHTNWADSSGQEPRHGGLTEFGKEVVRELNRLGVMVDISHVADKTFYDALEVSRAPMIASHSSMRALANVPRNMTDDMVRALASKGGVIQITFVDGFLSQELADAREAVRAEREARFAEIDRLYPDDEARRIEERQRFNRELAARMPRVSWEKIIEHIDYAVKLVGADHVGLGSDFDGASMPEGMEDISRHPRIAGALLQKGYSQKDVEKILGGNLLRVMEQAERVAREMQAR